MIDSLPTSWTEAALGELGEWGSGGTPPKKNESYYKNGTIPWLVIGDLNDGEVSKAKIHITEDGLHNSSAKLIESGTLLVAMYGSIGKLGITSIKCATNQAIAFCRPDSNIVDLKFLFHALANANKELIAQGQGGAQQNISQTILKAQQIRLPPINEQRRIADKLDTTLAAVEACKQKLNNAAETIQRFRQSVLAAAVSGELTREWREERGITTEWEIQPIENVADARLGKMLDKSKNTGPERKYIGNINVRWFEFDLSNLSTIRVSDEEFQKLSLQPGDLLVCEGGEPGRCAVWEQGTTPITYQKALHRIRPKPNIDSHFLSFCFKNAAEDGSLQKLFTGSTIKHLTGRSLSKFKVPVPSKQEQEMVISKTLALLEVASTIESKIFKTKSVLNRLTSAILSKAFRGELVPQDPNDEPATVLLERIKAQRDAEAAAKKPAKRGRKKKADAAQLVIPEGIADNHLAKVLDECGALSERALLAASELEPNAFELQLAKETGKALIMRNTEDMYELTNTQTSKEEKPS